MRLRQELRKTIQDFFEEMGVYTDALPGGVSSVDLLADRVLGIPAFAKASAAERYNLPTMGANSTEMAQKRAMLAERIEAELLLTVDLKKQAWERVLNKIVSAEMQGESFDKYVQWYRAGNEYNRPKTFQIAKNPALIFGNWKEAQMYETPKQNNAPYEIS